MTVQAQFCKIDRRVLWGMCFGVLPQVLFWYSCLGLFEAGDGAGGHAVWGAGAAGAGAVLGRYLGCRWRSAGDSFPSLTAALSEECCLLRSLGDSVRGAGVQSSASVFAVQVLCWCLLFVGVHSSERTPAFSGEARLRSCGVKPTLRWAFGLRSSGAPGSLPKERGLSWTPRKPQRCSLANQLLR